MYESHSSNIKHIKKRNEYSGLQFAIDIDKIKQFQKFQKCVYFCLLKYCTPFDTNVEDQGFS